MGYPADTILGDTVEIVQKHIEDGVELFLSRCGKWFTRDVREDVHKLIFVVKKEEGEAIGEIAKTARAILAGEKVEVEDILADTEEELVNDDVIGDGSEPATEDADAPAVEQSGDSEAAPAE